jgi:acetyl-CoA carboxylase biotin carboxylase subunit
MFKRILIANRGEIAIRIINAARELGVESVAIFHEVDKKMPYVMNADYAFEVKGDTPKSAYLDINQIIKIAKESKAEAIHPGYGFLSENAKFSQACIDNNVKFIGPKPHSIEVMGSKTEARILMEKAGVPIVPGTKEKIEDFDKAKEIARKIGYPILLKAAAGGGGKGMRLVNTEDEFIESYQAAQREALKSFGDNLVYMEKYILNPKHIEIQIIADSYGNIVHLGERDCSIQRRHQKVIEEAPSTVLNEDLRNRMGEVAIEAARACNYEGAGTIEFLLDENKDFYFLEMNTRLQVEHPVTELVTGVDLAKEQIRIASGLELSFKQDDIKINSFSIECRIYAEDPLNNFLPSIGKINYLQTPAGNGVRVDGGIEGNDEISIHFDPMISKLITFGKTRDEALDKMKSALKNYKIVGFNNIIPFLIKVMDNNVFRNEWFDTSFIDKHFKFDTLEEEKSSNNRELVLISSYFYSKNKNKKVIPNYEHKVSNWKNKLLLK